MRLSTDELIEAVLDLPASDRIRVLERLLEATPDELPGMAVGDPGFLEELDRRAAEPENSVPVEDLWKAVDGEA
jgi:hypothetical protein